MADLKTATSGVPSVLVAQYLPSTEAAQFTATSGTTVQFTSAYISNTDTVPRTVTLSIVKSGGSPGGSNRVLPTITLAAGATLDLGEFWLGEGDFISGAASAASTVTIILTGIVFSSTTVGALTGIQDDTVGPGGRTAGTGTVTGSNAISAGGNRYLLAAMLAESNIGTLSYTGYSTLSMTCSDGAMTRLVSCDFTSGGGVIGGSVHIFGRPNPTSNSTQTLTGSVASSGASFNLTLASMSLSGVASTSGAASSGPGTAATPSLGITSALNNRVFFAGGFYAVPQDFNQRVRAFNGNGSSGFTVPHWLLFADAPGASTVTATSTTSQSHCIVGINLIPA